MEKALKSTITENYEHCVNTPSSTSELLPYLRELSKECSTIVELGVGDIISTWAFLQGLLENGKSTKQLISVDIEKHENMEKTLVIANQEGVQMFFKQSDSVKVQIPERELLFIDTWHIYGHLKRELETHHGMTSKYIIMHDTVVDALYGESIRGDADIEKQANESGYPIEEIKEGLSKAIAEFICDHIHEWKIHKVFYQSFGLTVLQRI